jgi:8-amino-7-oxononanoate synthase
MTRKSGKRILTRGVKDAVLSLVKQSAGRQARPTTRQGVARSGELRVSSFEGLATYQQLKKQRAAADLLGVANPFFRAHDGRAGATTRIGTRMVINFASYDYLGLNQHPAVGAMATAAIDRYGTSASASRVVAGERPIHRELESALASLYGAEDAVAFVSGHATNVATIGELMGPKDLILHDALIHNSALVGAQLSGAVRRSFPHNDLDALERLLAASRKQHDNVLIVVEGLYSMDGDVPDLARLIEIKNRHGAWLMVDEAHALGTLGARGRGSWEHCGIDPRAVEIWMGTLSKTLAACGGFIAGATALVEILKFQASGFVYSVGLSPALAGAALAALELMQGEENRITRLQANARQFRETAQSRGLDTGFGQGHAVVPVMIGDSLKAAKLSERLLERGLNVLPIIYPAVPMQSARLRFFISSEHTEAQIKSAVEITKDELDRLDREGFSLANKAAALMLRQGLALPAGDAER